MEFRHLEYFEAIVEAGSLSQAARKLKMTQPPLSYALAKLEEELGVRLLERTPKGVLPTNAGLHMLSNGAQLLAQRDRLTSTLAMMGEGLIGELRLGVEPMVTHQVVADAMAEFMEQVPQARVTVDDTSPEAILRGVRVGSTDIGCIPFGPEQFTEYFSARYDWRVIARIPLKLAVPQARGGELHPGGRGWGRWVLPQRIPGFPGMPEAVRSAVGDEEDFDVLQVSNPQTALPFVAAGLGVSPGTELMTRKHRGVIIQDAPEWLAPMHVTVVWRRGEEMTPLMQKWLEVVTYTAAVAERNAEDVERRAT